MVKNLRNQLAGVLALAFLLWASAIALAQTSLTLTTLQLTIARYKNVQISNKEVDDILIGTNVLLWCGPAFERVGPVATLPSQVGGTFFNGIAKESIQMDDLDSMADSVKIVAKIDICIVNGDPVFGNYDGCVWRSGKSLIVKRLPTLGPQTRVWAHELAHIRGLVHRSDANALMHPIGDMANREISAAECKTLGGVRP